MVPLSIRVSGKSTITRHPERAILKLDVKAEGQEKESISNEVTSTSNEIHKIFKDLSPKTEFGTATNDAPVTVFSSTSLSTYSTRVNNRDGMKIGRAYHARSSFHVKFRNLAKLSQVVGNLLTYPNVEINSIEWCLTDETQRSLSAESRKSAMRNAIEKASDFAEVIGRKVVPVEIEDGGQASYQQAVQQMSRQMMIGAAQGQSHDMSSTSLVDGNGGLNMSPQDIRYTGTVQVRFETAE